MMENISPEAKVTAGENLVCGLLGNKLGLNVK